MNLIGSHDTILSIVYHKAQDRGWIFIAMKIREAAMKSHKTIELNWIEFHSKLLCRINQLLTWHMSFKQQNYNYIKLWQSWRGKTRGHLVLTMNAHYNSTESYHKKKEKFKLEEKKGGVLLLYLDINNLTLPRPWWMKWLLLKEMHSQDTSSDNFGLNQKI